jgi:hypothetical protein
VLRGVADPASLEQLGAAKPVGNDVQIAELHERLKKHLLLIGAIVAAIDQSDLPPQLDQVLLQMAEHGWTKLIASIRRILNGERSADALLSGLDEEDTLIVSAILAGIEDPAALRALLDATPARQPED